MARDVHHATSVCRSFFWSQLNLWPDQLPAQTLVVLSGKDDLVPVEATMKMLTGERPDVELLLHKEHKHADFIKDLAWQDLVVQKVVELVETAAAAGPSRMMLLPLGVADSASAMDTRVGADDLFPSALVGGAVVRRRDSRHGRCDSACSWELLQQQVQPVSPNRKMCTRSASRAAALEGGH